MARIAVLGATGTVGRRVAALLAARGHDLVLIGRDEATAGALAQELAAAGGGPRDGVHGGSVEVRSLDVTGPDEVLRAAFDGVDVAVNALPVTGGAATRALDAAVTEAVHLVDVGEAQPHLVHAFERHHDTARATGTVVVVGAGWRTGLGDLLAAVAGERVLAAREVHVAAVVPDPGGVLRAAGPGTRRAIASALGRPTLAFHRGERTEELTGEERRLAWFPRPFGPRHAAGVPGLEALSVPRYLPQVRTVRSYVAVSSLQAELLQAAANLARWAPARRRLQRPLERGVSRRRPAAARWAVVAEVAGEDGLARAWANGHDAEQASALLATTLVATVLDGTAAPGVIPPALAGRPGEVLDAMAAASSTRWSVSRPRD